MTKYGTDCRLNQSQTEGPGPALSQQAQYLVDYYARNRLGELVKVFIARQGAEKIAQHLWSVVAEVLDSQLINRQKIAWTIAKGISDSRPADRTDANIRPKLEIVDRFFASPKFSLDTIKYFQDCFSINPLDLFARPFFQECGSIAVGLRYAFDNLDQLLKQPQNNAALKSFFLAVAMRRDGFGLQLCADIKSSIIGAANSQDDKRKFLEGLRDDLTRELCRSSHGCERNLKISLLFPREVPHPCLDYETQLLTEDQRWILGWREYLLKGCGADQLQWIDGPSGGVLSSDSFIPNPRHLDVGPIDFSKFHDSAGFKSRIFRFLGLTQDPVDTHRSRPPRNWLSDADQVRYQASRIVGAFAAVAELYIHSRPNDRDVSDLKELFQSLLRHQPRALAEAGPAVRRLNHRFVGDLLEIIDKELSVIAREAKDSDSKIRDAFIVASGFYITHSELTPKAILAFEQKLQAFNEASLSNYCDLGILAASPFLMATNAGIERRAIELIERHPETLGASLLAYYLFVVRCSDSSVKQVIKAQAQRNDLPNNIWLNYAHAAVGFGLNSAEHTMVQSIFNNRAVGLRVLARWCPRSRDAWRRLMGALAPKQIEGFEKEGERRYDNRSPLDKQIMEALRASNKLRVSEGLYLPMAPKFYCVVTVKSQPLRPILVLTDGRFNAVNGALEARGYDGHTLLGTRILRGAGFAVVRISTELGRPEQADALSKTVAAVVEYVSNGTVPDTNLVVIDPPEDFTGMRGKAILFNPTGLPRTVIAPL